MDEIKATITLPPRIAEEAEGQIRQGWFSDLNSLVIEALRRYLESRPNEMNQEWIHSDVEWGLNGDE